MIRHPARNEDAGLGMIELIVAIVIAGIVMTAVASMFISSWRAQAQVTSVSEATNRGQIIGSSIERAMRNALWFDVPASYGGDVLVVSTSLPGAMKCQGFRLTAGSAPAFGEARLAMAQTSLQSDPTMWSRWGDAAGITKQGTTAYFTKTPAGTLSYRFQIATDGAPVKFAGEVGPRSTQSTGSDGCW